MQDWLIANTEITERLEAQVLECKKFDLWADQPYYQDKEDPLPKIGIYTSWNSDKIDEIGGGVQDLHMKVKVYLYFETIGNSYLGAKNRAKVLAFGAILRKIHKALHGWSGANCSALTRVRIHQEEPMPGSFIYSQEYSVIIRDYGAAPEVEEVDYTGDETMKIVLQKGVPEPTQGDWYDV